jgi:hypothetical protein
MNTIGSHNKNTGHRVRRRSDNGKNIRGFPLSLVLGGCLAMTGRGPPDRPDIKGKWHDAVRGPGLYTSVYPKLCPLPVD